MASSSRSTLGKGAAIAAVLALLLAGVFWFASRGGADKGASDQPPTDQSQPTTGGLPGYVITDLFSDQRLAFPYKNRTWQDAYGEPKQGVREIVLTTHCGLSDITKCAVLRLTDIRSTEFDRRFGDAPVVNVLNQETCPYKGGGATTAFVTDGRIDFAGLAVDTYIQQLCAPTQALPVPVTRYVWMNESLGVLVELNGTPDGFISDGDLKDVTTSLEHLSKMDD